MTEKEYRSHPAISRSELWRMHDSPEKFKWFKDHPEPATPALLFGQVAHKMLLEPEDFDSEFVVAPNVDRRTKAGKAQWEEFQAEAADKTVVSQDFYQTAAEMREAVMRVPSAANLLSGNGENERPFFWVDELTGVECKCRTDRIIFNEDGGVTIVDYKTSANAETGAFNSSIFKYGYNLQAAMYSEGVMKALCLTERPDFVFIVQEKKPPYSVNVVEVSEDVMTYGLDVFRELIGTYKECMDVDFWPGYTGFYDEPNESYLPGYVTLGEEQEENDE